MNEVLKTIGKYKLVPVVAIEQVEHALPLGEALLAAGLPLAEITFRTQAAEAVIKTLTDKIPNMLVGAGTVLSIDQVKRAVDAGARFMVSPGFNPKVVDFCLENGITMTPGISSPTLIEMAVERHLEVVKFFPAEASGGLPLLKAMAAPFSGIKFIPTGGIDQTNLKKYIEYNRVHAVGGSWFVKKDLISAEKFDEIRNLAEEGLKIIHHP